MAKLDQALLGPRWSQQTRSRLAKATNGLARSFKPADLAEALRDVLGVAVKKGASCETYVHLDEVTHTLESLEEARRASVTEIKLLVGAGGPPRLGSNPADSIAEIRERTQDFLGIAR